MEYVILLTFLVLFFCFWFGCGFIAAGFSFAYFQREFYRIRGKAFKSNQDFALTAFLCGWVSLMCYLSKSSRKHGWLNPWGKKAKIEAGLQYE